MALQEIAVQLDDIDDVLSVLGACQNYFDAKAIQEAQIFFGRPEATPIQREIATVMTKYGHYRSDLLVAAHLAAVEEDDEDQDWAGYELDVEDPEEPQESKDDDLDNEAEEGVEEPQEGSEELAEGETEELPPLPEHPLGDFQPPRQKSRRLKVDEV